MTDYDLGRAHGKIEIDYDGTGTSKAIHDLDKVAKSSDDLDKSLSKTEKSLRDTDRQMDSSSSSAQGYNSRLREVRQSSEDVDRAEKAYRATLLDSKATLSDIERAHDNVTSAKQRHAKATKAAADADKAFVGGLNVGQRALHAFDAVLPSLQQNITKFAKASEGAAAKSTTLAKSLGVVAKAVALFGPEGKAAAVALESVAGGVDKVGSSAVEGGGHVRNFIKDIAGFEAAFGKISGISLAVPSLGGLAGLGGAAATQGVVEVADAIKQLSGALGLLPAVISGAGFSAVTLKVAFHGVGDALKDMMADDPKKFLTDIQNMGPAAARSMIQVAQFRDMFKLSGAAIQDSFFTKIAADIAPLIQTWLPALTSGMSKVAGIFGDFAHQFAGILEQPATMAAFQGFVDNLGKGLAALQPAIAPLMHMMTQLTTVGSGFFSVLGDIVTHAAQSFDAVVSKAAGSGELQQWINTGIDAFLHLANTVYYFGSAFLNVMNIAEKFGGGGLLGFLEKLGTELDAWTQSSEGQKSLTQFFTTLREATDAFLPILKPLVEGVVSIGSAFVQLGIATAPAWLDFFKTFASVMDQMGPNIVGMGPAVNGFLSNLAAVMIRLTQSLGPQLPQIFEDLSNAFVALLPQIPALVTIFTQLVEQVGPQLPQLFDAVTQAITDLTPLMPQIIGLIRTFVSVVTDLVQLGSGVEITLGQIVNGTVNGAKAIGDFVSQLPQKLSALGDGIGKFFADLPNKALEWGKKLVEALIRGMLDSAGLSGVDGAAHTVVDRISGWFQRSPAEKGPFSGSGYTLIRGQKMVTDLASGMVSAQGAVVSAARSTAVAASGALAAGISGAGGAGGAGGARGGGAPAPGGAGSVGNALLPPNIANADTSVLDAYLNHQFPENRGLKGLAKNFGNILQIAQNGFNLVYQHGIQPLLQAMGAIPNQQTWRKIPAGQFAAQQAAELQRKAMEGKQGLTWAGDVGIGRGTGVGPATGLDQIPLGLNPNSSKPDIQKAIIAAGRARGMNDAQIQAALAIGADESGFNPNAPNGGLYQQQNSRWGTPAQIADPNHAINEFYNAFAQELAKNPTDPLLAAVLTQNPQLGGGAKGSAYWNAVMAQVPLAGNILAQLGPGVKNMPPVPQVQIPGMPAAGPGAAGPTGSRFLTPIGGSAGQPLSALLPSVGGIAANPLSRASSLGGAGANYTPQTMAAAGIAPLFNKSGADSMAGAPAWVNQLAAAFGLTATSHADTTLHGGVGQMGDWAFDFGGSVENMQRFADFIRTNLASQTLQAIWQNPQTGQQLGIAGGQILGPGQYYTTPGGTYGDHRDHVHWATDVPVLINGQLPPGAMVQPGATPLTSGGQAMLPSGQTTDQVLATQNLSATQRLLDAYLQGNPALAAQIDAAKTPGASDEQVLSTLNTITTTINGLKAQDAVGNQNTIQALQSAQQQIAQGQGFTQGQSPLQSGLAVASAIGSGASSVITGAFQLISSGLDALGGTQDIADRAVYGLRNTQDVGKIIDDFQKYITFAANVASEVGNVLNTIGSVISAVGQAGAAAGSPMGGDPGAAVAAVGQAFQIGGMISELVSGVLQGINATIDYVQQVNQIVGGYVGRFLSNLTAGPFGGTPLMGNVRFLLNKNTGQLIDFSEDNPLNQNTQNVPALLAGLYGFGNANPNPQKNTQFNIYGGPGQSAAQLLNASMWTAATSGTTGALAAANF